MSDPILSQTTMIQAGAASVGKPFERPGRFWSYTLTVERPKYIGPDGSIPPPFPVGGSAIVEVSNDGKGWILFGTLTAPVTDDIAVDSTGIFGDTAYVLHRASITGVSGVGASAYVSAVRGA